MRCAHTRSPRLCVFLFASLGLFAVLATGQDKIPPDLQIELNNRGTLAFKSGRLQEAAALFDEAIRLGPDDPTSNANLGQSLYVLGRFAEAATAFEKAAGLDPGNPRYHNALAVVYGQIGRTSDAISAAENALAIEETGKYYYNLGNILVRAGNTRRALPFLEKAAKLDPTDATIRRELGFAYTLLSKHAKAIAELEAAVRLDPNLAGARKVLGELYLRQGNRTKALAEYRQLKDSGSPFARELFEAITDGRVVRVSTVDP